MTHVMKTAFLFTARIHRQLWKPGLLFVSSMALCFALLQTAQAVNPPPDGGYPGGNTAEGQNALLSLDTTTAAYNTGLGFFSLSSDTTGNFNTGVGAGTFLPTPQTKIRPQAPGHF
jgi:hypothetical protein